MKKNHKTGINFGLHGWLLIFFGFWIFMLTGTFWSSIAVNVILPQFVITTGVDYAVLLRALTVIGWITLIPTIPLGRLFAKFGARKTLTVFLAILGVALLFFGRVTNYWQYFVVFTIINISGGMAMSVGMPQIYTKYFPTKKGSVLGWATVGASAGSFIGLPVLVLLIGSLGFASAVLCFGIFFLVLAVINYCFIPNTPEEMHKLPDNGDILESELKVLSEDSASAVPAWSLKEAMCNKNFWIIPIGYGLIYLVTSGIAMQFVAFLMQNGMTQGEAIGRMSIGAFIGILGSIVSGWLDQRIGVKKTSLLCSGCLILACFMGGVLKYSTWSVWAFLVIYAFWMGSVTNLPQSHAIGLYKPSSYMRLWPWMLTIMLIVRALNATVLSGSLVRTGSLQPAYVVFMVLSAVALVLLAFSDETLQKKPGLPPEKIKG